MKTIHSFCALGAFILVQLFVGCVSEHPAWKGVPDIYQGIKYQELERTEPRLMKTFVMRVDLQTKGLKFTGTPRADHWGEQMPDFDRYKCSVRTRLQRTADFMREQRKPVEEGGRGRNLVVAINTEPWEPFESPFTNKYAYVYSPMISDGVVVSAGSTGGGAVFVVNKDGSAQITKGITATQSSNIWVAATGFNIIMTNGVDIAKKDDFKLAPRTAFGLSKDNRYLYLMAIDGRQEGWSLGANMHDICKLMTELGANDAMNMDGGGSTTLVRWDEETENAVVCNRQSTNGFTRAVAASVGIYFEDGVKYKAKSRKKRGETR